MAKLGGYVDIGRGSAEETPSDIAMTAAGLSHSSVSHADVLHKAARGGTSRLLLSAFDLGIDLADDPDTAFSLMRVLRRAGDPNGAAHLAGAVAARHPQHPALLQQCLRTLHHLEEWGQALELVEHIQARSGRALKLPLRLVKADCLERLGAPHAARMVLDGAVSAAPSPEAEEMRARIEPQTAVPLDADVAACATALVAGRSQEGERRYHAILEKAHARSRIAAPVQPGRDREAEGFARDFRRASGTAPPPSRAIALLSDSIAMPRPAAGVDLEHTYPSRVDKMIRAVSDLGLTIISRRGNTAPDGWAQLWGRTDHCRAIMIQLGLVDCFPRAYHPLDIQALVQTRGPDAAKTMLGLGRAFRHVLEARPTASPYVPLDVFGPLLAALVSHSKKLAGDVFLMTIVTPAKCGRQERETAIARSVGAYNQKIRRIAEQKNVTLIDLDEALWARPDAVAFFVKDNQHLNRLGHHVAAEIISQTLKRVLALG